MLSLSAPAKNPLADFFKKDKEPTAQSLAIATQAGLSELGKKIFYNNEPVVLDRALFSEACNKQHEGAAALGCYDGKKIYLFKIAEPRLQYMLGLTAAHEMLHAAYEELSNREKKRIDLLVEDLANAIKDPFILEKIAEYKSRDPRIMPSELHSIIGTEIEHLPPELEAHYAQYFKNRRSLVALARNYYTDVQSRKNSIEASDTQLESLKKEIDLQGKILKAKQGHLDILKKEIEERPANRKIEAFNRLAQEFNDELKAYQSLINRFNALARARNLKATESQSFTKRSIQKFKLS